MWFGHVACNDTLLKTNPQSTHEGGRHCSGSRKSWTVNVKDQIDQEMPVLQQMEKELDSRCQRFE